MAREEVRELEARLAAVEQLKKRPPPRQTIDHESGQAHDDDGGATRSAATSQGEDTADDGDKFFGAETFQDSTADVRACYVLVFFVIATLVRVYKHVRIIKHFLYGVLVMLV